MFSWHAIPFARLLLPLLTGITLSESIRYRELNAFHSFLVLGCSLGILTLLWIFLYRRYGLQTEHRSGFLYFIFTVTAAYGLNNTNQAEQIKGLQNSDTCTFILKIEGNALVKKKSISAYAVIENVCADLPVSEYHNKKIVLKFDTALLKSRLITGDRLAVVCKIMRVRSPDMPGDFNYAAYLRRKGILYTLQAQTVPVFLSPETFSFRRISEKAAASCMEILDRYLPEAESRGISKALLIGYKAELDAETSSYFSKTGTLHVLAVSGLHASLIYMALLFMTGFLKKKTYGRILQACLVLSGLWMYAFITGLSPSVCRAVIMCSVLSTGDLFLRKTNTYNSIYASAFLMLADDPQLLFDAGFQLSYAAVLGIILLYPKLRQTVKLKRSVYRKLWDLCCVTLASQVFTLPLSLYYFHQFPSYFLLSNILVVPLFTILLQGLILLLIISPFQWPAELLGKLLTSILNYNTEFLSFSAGLPYSQLGPFNPGIPETVVLYLSIFLILACIIHRNSTLFLLGLVSILISSIMRICSYAESTNNKMIGFHHVGKGTLITCINGHKAYILTDSIFDRTYSAQNHLRNYLIHYGISECDKISLSENLVSTNIRVISDFGFQFFDTVVTMNSPVQFNRRTADVKRRTADVNWKFSGVTNKHNTQYFNELNRNKTKFYIYSNISNQEHFRLIIPRGFEMVRIGEK